jgi:DNA gyrase subunit A
LTRGGQIKKTSVVEYQNFREKGIIGVKIADDDQLLSAVVTDGNAEFLIATKQGKCIRFDEKQVRPMGRSAAGVKAIELSDDDEVVGVAFTEPERDQVLAMCERGFGKRTKLEEFRSQNRGGKGIILIECSDRNGKVVGIALVKPEDEIMLITDRGQTIRTRVSEIRETGRNAQGVKVMNVSEGERVVALESVGESRAASVLDDEGEAAAVPGEPPAADGEAPDTAADAEAPDAASDGAVPAEPEESADGEPPEDEQDS